MTLMVRDEQDVLRANIEHHLDQGVDHVVLTDHRSTDGSRAIAAEYERAGVLTLLDETSEEWDQSAWVTGMARLAATELGADWVLNNDADEFWFAPTGTLHEHLAGLDPTVTVAAADRHDLLVVEDPRWTSRDERPWHERLVYRYAAPRRSDGTPLSGKVCHRADPEVVVAAGNHRVHGPRLGEPVPTGLRILHAQLRSAADRREKVLVATAGYERTAAAGPTTGWHIREAAEHAQAGTYDEWWRGRTLDVDELTRLVLAGEVVADHRVRDAVERATR